MSEPSKATVKSTVMSEAARAMLLAEVLGDVNNVAKQMDQLKIDLGAMREELKGARLAALTDRLSGTVEQMQSSWPTLMSAQVRAELVRDMNETLGRAAQLEVKAAAHRYGRQILALIILVAFLGGVVVTLVTEQLIR